MEFPTNGKPVCFVMVGLPGSGKSTWARRTKLPMASSDAHIERMCKLESISYSEGFIRFYSDAVKQMNEEVKELISSESPFVWDQTNLTKKKRRKILSALNEKYYAVAVVLDAPVEQCVRRRKEGNFDHKEVAERIIRDMAGDRSEVSLDEGFQSIMNVGTWL